MLPNTPINGIKTIIRLIKTVHLAKQKNGRVIGILVELLHLDIFGKTNNFYLWGERSGLGELRLNRNQLGMLNKKLLFAAVSVTASVLFHASTQAQKIPGKAFHIHNYSEFERKDEPLILTRTGLETTLKTNFNINKFIVIRNDLGKEIPSQMDDIDGDGIWDEVALLIDVDLGDKTKLYLEKVDAKPRYPKATQIWLGVSPNKDNNFSPVTKETMPYNWKAQSQPMRYQLEGPGWENDKIGFRHYFDSRNGKDIFSKKTNELVLHKIGIPGTELGDYHKEADWGMDVLKVGNSLGGGGFAFVVADKLIPMGNGKEKHFEVVSEGPVRAILKLTHVGVPINGKAYTVTETITIWKGKYWFKNEVSVAGVGTENGVDLAIGFTNLKFEGKPSHIDEFENYIGLATHGKQSENGDILGMAVVVPKAQFNGFGEAPKAGDGVVSSYYCKTNFRLAKPITYYFMAYWEKSNPKFAQNNFFLESVKNEMDEFDEPLEIRK